MDRVKFNKVVSQLSTWVDKDGNRLRMSSLVVSDAEGSCAHAFDTDPGQLVDLRSVSKVVLALVLGVAERKGLRIGTVRLHRDMHVAPVLRSLGLATESQTAQWEDVRLWHLMNNTIGHESGFMFRKDIGERDPYTLLSYIFSARLDHRPGAHFSYSNVGPYLVSAILHEASGKSVGDLAAEWIFAALEIERFSWGKYGKYDAGCSGLSLSGDSLHKVARLVSSRGIHKGSEIVPSEWCDLMRSPITPSPGMYDPSRVFPKWAYGLGLWVCEDGSYYCDGTDGQYLIVVPRVGLVITTEGSQPDMKPITRAMLPLLQ